MRLYPQTYPGNGIPRPAAGTGPSVLGAWDAAASKASVVRSNTLGEIDPDPQFDFEAIERRARAARSVWVGSMLRSGYRALMGKRGSR